MARSESGFDLTLPSSRARTHLEADLTSEESEVLLRRGTEAPFCGAHLDEERSALFTCRLCGLPLLLGGHKFDGGTGWPSLRRPSTRIIWTKSETRATAWCARSFSAPAAAATTGTCSPTCRRPRAGVAASTPCRWTSLPPASRCRTRSAAVPQRRDLGEDDSAPEGPRVAVLNAGFVGEERRP